MSKIDDEIDDADMLDWRDARRYGPGDHEMPSSAALLPMAIIIIIMRAMVSGLGWWVVDEC